MKTLTVKKLILSNVLLNKFILKYKKYKFNLLKRLINNWTKGVIDWSGRPKENNKKSLITPIFVGMTTILAIVIFGRRFS